LLKVNGICAYMISLFGVNIFARIGKIYLSVEGSSHILLELQVFQQRWEYQSLLVTLRE